MKSIRIIPHRFQGFTLVELLVVIVIIAVLGTLGFMGGRKAMDSAAKTKTMGHLRQLASATQMFSADHNGALMDWNGTIVDGEKRNWSHHLLVTLNPDLANNGDYKNSAGDNIARSLGIFSDSKALKQAKGKLAKTGHNSWRTYAYNNRIGAYTPESPEPIPYKQGAKYAHEVETPNKLILFSQRILDGSQYFSFLQPEDGQNDKLDFNLYGGSIMVGFYDGHVEMIPKRNYPSQIGSGINPSTKKPFSEKEWREYWWGRTAQSNPL